MTDQPGFRGSALVVHRDETVYALDQGNADERSGTPCTPRTRFQIASVSKQFTAAAVMLLVERGTVAPDHEVGRWIHDCPPSWRGITVHHLLTHTSGLGHWEDFPDLDLTAWLPPEEAVKAFQASAPRFAPGTAWYYSRPGYVLLAHLVERAGDEPYRQFLTRRILEPLGLHDTFAGSPGTRPDIATGHAANTATPSYELDVLGMGAGDIWSTTGDLLRWNRAMTTDALLGAPSRHLLLTSHAATGLGGLDGYGYGWQTGRIAGRRVLCHSGDNAGFKSFNAWFPDHASHIIVLSNDDATAPGAMVTHLTTAHIPDEPAARRTVPQ